MAKFEIKVEKAGDVAKVSVGGVIDEDADFNPFPLADAKKVDINVGAIKSINSCGIRECIKWLGTAPTAQVVYHECPKIIVDQMNMVAGFLPATTKVESFYVPYYSDSSGSEKMILFQNGKEFKAGEVHAPPDIKDDAGETMEMDVIEAKYFKFLKNG